MSDFEAGSIVGRIQMVGAAAATNDLNGLQQAFDAAAQQAVAAGTATDRADDANTRVAASARQAATAEAQVGQAAQRTAAQQGTATSATQQSTSARQRAMSAAERYANANEQERAAIVAAAQASAEQEEQYRQATRTSAQLAAEEEANAERRRQAMSEVGVGIAATGAAIAAFGVLAVKEYADFDEAVSGVQATVQETAGTLNELRTAAIDAGASTSFSATEAANAENELAKAGVAVNDILNGGLKGSLALAAAGQLGVADSAGIAATAMVQFGLSGSDIPHVADLLAAGAGKAQGSVEDLSQALNQSGLVAGQMGISVEETTGTLAAFASAGLLGSDAGTSFKTMLLALANPSTQAQQALDEYNISAYDTSGNLVTMTDLAGQLEKAFKGKTQAEKDSALATIFGSDAIRAANVLYSDGAAGIQEWTDKVNDAGYAAQQAAMLQDNLKGDVEKLGGAFSSALINSGGAANDVLRDMVQSLTYLVSAFGDLNGGTLQTIGIISLFGGSILVAGGLLMGGVGKVAQFKQSLQLLGVSTDMTRGKMALMGLAAGAVGAALAAGTILLGQWIASQAQAQAQTDAFQQSLDQQSGSFTDYTEQLVVQNLNAKQSFLWMQSDSALDSARRLGLSLDTVTQAAMGNAEAYKTVQDASHAFDMQNRKTHDYNTDDINAWQTVTQAIDDQRSKLSAAQRAQANANAAAAKTKQAQQDSKDAYDETSKAIEAQKNELDELISKMMEANGQAQDAVQANKDLQDATAAIVDQIKKQKDGTDGAKAAWDENTQAGADNQAMLADWAKKSQDAAQAALDAGGSMKDFEGDLKSGRAALIRQAEALGASKDQAVKFADAVYSIPSKKDFTLIANTHQAQQDLNSFITTNDGRVIQLRTQLITQAIDAGAAAGTAKAAYNADGNVLHFAGGGQFRENHIAQKAAAGTMRVWAEPETGGEAYIPLAPSKRARSTALLQEVASEFGYTLAAQTAQNGAVGVSPGSSGAVRITGRVDMGNGLTGMIDGMIEDALTGVADSVAKG